jgi:hypothetical protein
MPKYTMRTWSSRKEGYSKTKEGDYTFYWMSFGLIGMQERELRRFERRPFDFVESLSKRTKSDDDDVVDNFCLSCTLSCAF